FRNGTTTLIEECRVKRDGAIVSSYYYES
ncbi:MAG: hypothetical protein PWQ07_1, partial [Kosmotoga sp.]|nr:hypothetical protein [Kosmotoga sp.]